MDRKLPKMGKIIGGWRTLFDLVRERYEITSKFLLHIGEKLFLQTSKSRKYSNRIRGARRSSWPQKCPIFQKNEPFYFQAEIIQQVMILVSIPMFWGSKNSVRQVSKITNFHFMLKKCKFQNNFESTDNRVYFDTVFFGINKGNRTHCRGHKTHIPLQIYQ